MPSPASFGGMRTVIARAPTRIDFGGGWTDVPPYSDEEGGRVCNVAIDRYAQFTITVDAETSSDVRSMADSVLAQAVTRHFGISGIRSTLRSDFPTGAGLGGSSAVGVAMVAAFRHWKGDTSCDRPCIAELSRRIEVEEAGIAGGRQDHYAAAFGGALDLTFGASTEVSTLPLPEVTRTALEQRCIVVYTGQSRISGETITAVIDAYRRREPRVLDALGRMKSLAGEMAASLAAGDLDALGDQLEAHWTFQRSLHPAIPTEQIDAVLGAAKSRGARGGKALGASGGGCVAVIAPSHAVDAVRVAMHELARPVEYRVDTAGVTVTEHAS